VVQDNGKLERLKKQGKNEKQYQPKQEQHTGMLLMT
jgi:hypothetical protein